MVRNDPFLSNSSVISCNDQKNELDFQKINLLLPASAIMPSGNIHLLDSIKKSYINLESWEILLLMVYTIFSQHRDSKSALSQNRRSAAMIQQHSAT